MHEVLHCITTIDRGGAENQLLTLAIEQKKSGLKVRVIYLKGSAELADQFSNAGIEVLNFIANLNPFFQIIKLKNYLKNYPGILHSHLPRAELIGAISKSDGPFVVSKHNSEKFIPKAPNFLSRIFSRYVLHKSDYCIVISRAVSNYLISINELYVTDTFSVVHYGIPTNFPTSRKNVNHGHDKSDLIKIGTIGRIVTQKDYPTLLHAFSLLGNKLKSYELLVVGDGALKNKMINLAKKLKINESIRWIGKVTDVESVLSEMDLFVLSSKYEGFGLVLLEAMQSRIPILAANNSAISEVLGSDYPGLFNTGNSDDLYNKIMMCESIDFKDDLVFFADQRMKCFDSIEMSKSINNIYGIIN